MVETLKGNDIENVYGMAIDSKYLNVYSKGETYKIDIRLVAELVKKFDFDLTPKRVSYRHLTNPRER